ncbi:hypothetical protein F4782DRAFT_253659 [Xylaria castorea]|nr:hypothetical protein F4782DRAFT_253659 [Xylaria castorea]
MTSQQRHSMHSTGPHFLLSLTTIWVEIPACRVGRIGSSANGADISRTTKMRFGREDLLGDYQVTLIDRLWIALVAVEAGIILCVLVSRILQARKRKAREGIFSTLPS